MVTMMVHHLMEVPGKVEVDLTGLHGAVAGTPTLRSAGQRFYTTAAPWLPRLQPRFPCPEEIVITFNFTTTVFHPFFL